MWEKEFAQRLNRVIYISGLEHNTVSKRLGIGRATLFRYRVGISIPDAKTIAKMCELFGCDADYLILGIIHEWEKGK